MEIVDYKEGLTDHNMLRVLVLDNLWYHNNPEKDYISSLEIFDWTQSKISLRKITSNQVMQRAYNYTSAGSKEFSIGDKFAYTSGHSPDRTQCFELGLEYVPNFATVHLLRHDKFAYHYENFIMTGREDRDGLGREEHRYSPKNHMIVINVAELKQIALTRLCQKAHADVRYITYCIKELVSEMIPELGDQMVPFCVANGRCKEGPMTCKKINKMYKLYAEDFYKYISKDCLPVNREKYYSL